MIVCAKAIGAHAATSTAAPSTDGVRRLTIALAAAREKGYLGKRTSSARDSISTSRSSRRRRLSLGRRRRSSSRSRENAACRASGLPSPPRRALAEADEQTTTSRRTRTSRGYSRTGRAYRVRHREEPPARRSSRSPARSRTAVWPRFPWHAINDLVSRSAAESRKTGSSRRCRWAAFGGCIPASLGHTPSISNRSPRRAPSWIGRHVVMDDQTCMVEMARFFLNFTQDESCGKCTFCRVGTLRMLEILTRITQGKDSPRIRQAEDARSADQGLEPLRVGPDGAEPGAHDDKVLRRRVRAHIKEKRCPRRAAPRSSISASIRKNAPAAPSARRTARSTRSRERKKTHTDHTSICAKCGKCVTVCTFGAVYKK